MWWWNGVFRLVENGIRAPFAVSSPRPGAIQAELIAIGCVFAFALIISTRVIVLEGGLIRLSWVGGLFTKSYRVLEVSAVSDHGRLRGATIWLSNGGAISIVGLLSFGGRRLIRRLQEGINSGS
jgi:hypothetical protein